MQLRTALRVAIPTFIIITLLGLSLGKELFDATPTQADPGEETTYYLLTDHLGSVDVVLDEAGNVVERRDFLPYGSERLTDSTATVTKTDHKFTGKELDDETGLYYYGARYYDAEIGRFVSMDPYEGDPVNPQTLNKYSYVLNNPVKYVDPTGMYEKDVHYDMTFFLSLAAGLSYIQSGVIAENDQWIDDNPDTRPGKDVGNYINGATAKYHFAIRQGALMGVGEATNDESLSAFGMALHTYQDTYSHGEVSPEVHGLISIFTNNSPDYTYLDPDKALAMAKESFGFLRQFDKGFNGLDDMTESDYDLQTEEIWTQISSNVQDYLKLQDKTDTDIYNIARESEEEDLELTQ